MQGFQEVRSANWLHVGSILEAEPKWVTNLEIGGACQLGDYEGLLCIRSTFVSFERRPVSAIY